MNISIASYSFHGLADSGMMDVFGYLEACKYRYHLNTADIWNGLMGRDPGVYLKEDFLQKVKDALEERGLTLVNYHADGCHFWEPDGATREKHYQLALAHVKAAEFLGAKTVRIEMKQAFSPLLAQFADRAGIIHSPKAVAAIGNDQFGTRPVCAGPYRFVERVAQDRIVMERFEGYRDRDKFPPGRLVFLPVPDTTVRVANLRSGQLDLIERMSPNDVEQVKANKALGFASATSLGYQGLTFNIANGEKSKGPFGADNRLRAAPDYAIGRETLVQVVSGGIFTPGNQPLPPSSPFYVSDLPVQKRDLAKARALVKESGVANPSFTMLTPNTDIAKQAMEVIQAMAKEAGIDIKLQLIEFVTMLEQARNGNFDADYVGWSGRIDPDGNISNLLACKSAGNDGRYCNDNVEKLLQEAQLSVDPAIRKKSYDPAVRQILEDRPILYLWHGTWLYAFNAGLKGFVAYPDGIVRLNGVTLTKG